MQLRIEYSRITIQICAAFHQQSERLSDECQLPTQYLNSVQNVQQLQQHRLPPTAILARFSLTRRQIVCRVFKLQFFFQDNLLLSL